MEIGTRIQFPSPAPLFSRLVNSRHSYDTTRSPNERKNKILTIRKLKGNWQLT